MRSRDRVPEPLHKNGPGNPTVSGVFCAQKHPGCSRRWISRPPAISSAVEPLKFGAPFGWVGDAGSCLAVVGRAGAARLPEIEGYGRRKYRSGGAQGGFQHRSCNGRGRCPTGMVPFWAARLIQRRWNDAVPAPVVGPHGTFPDAGREFAGKPARAGVNPVWGELGAVGFYR